ncbi:MAG: hypothetical protein IPO83_16420 [Chitinophagaceae bacterium]|nr:hypothetical protein [Chitinophagaceae bacterium]
MSYDLYFYKRKGRQLSEQEIGDYLTKNLVTPTEESNQWFFDNEDTRVYFFINHNEPEDDPEAIELYESFEDFDNTHFTFNLNFLRPNFFGLEAFKFVDKFVTDLDLFILNPQSQTDPDNPLKVDASTLFENWSITNLRQSVDHFNEFNFSFFPLDRSDKLWEFNFRRNEMQDTLGDAYFVPKVFFMKRKDTGEAISLTIWSEHLPIVLPSVDYVLVTKDYKKLFRTVKEAGIVPYSTIIKNFGTYFDSYDFNDSKIIHPTNSEKVKDAFNGLKLEYQTEKFCEPLEMDKLSNSLPK